MTSKTIVCLANSRKLGDYCVAGIDLESGAWIRPIGSGRLGAVTAAEQRLKDGTRPGMLDLIEIPLERPAPEPAQPENWELAEGPWNSVGHLSDEEAREMLEQNVTENPVFGTNERSISADEAASGGVESSLAVIRPHDLAWSKELSFGKKKLRAWFEHAGEWHDLGVTDLAWIAEFADKDFGSYGQTDSEDVFLVISLAEPFNDEHYKLVAGVICLDSAV